MQRTPSHRRVRLGLALRDARLAAELTQTEAAKLVGRSQSWLNKAENAESVGIKRTDLDKLLAAYGLAGAAAAELRDFVRSPYDERGVWVDTSKDPVWWSRYQEVERKATVIKAVLLEALDGLIQSDAYMRRQFELSGSDVEAQTRARLARQQAILGQVTPPDCTFVLSEACLLRDMGDPAMMAVQLRHLVKLSERPSITLLIMPFDAPCRTSSYGFTFMQFDRADMGDFVNVEYEVGSATIDDEDALRVFQRRWELVRSASLGEHESRKFIRAVLREHEKRAKDADE